MFFVFNINDAMLKENEFTYRKRDTNNYDFGRGVPYSLNENSS